MLWGPAQAVCLAACVALLASAPAAAAPKRITGELSQPGYTVIAVAESGKGKAAKATRTSRRFSLVPPADRVTLHLRSRDGVYVGPIVVARSKNGKRAILGVKAGTRLGAVRIDSRKGYGTVRGLAKKRIDSRRFALAKKGVPIGAGKFGLVRSKVARRGAPPGDLDADGVADPLDIDDNGNLVLDKYEQPAAGTAAARTRDQVAAAAAPVKLYVVVLAVNADRSVRVRVCGIDIEATTRWPAGEPLPDVGKSYLVEVDKPDPINGKVLSVSGPLEEGGCPAAVYLPSVRPGLFLTLKDTVNANAAAVTLAQLNETLARRGFLWIGGQSKPDVRVELDCGGAPSPGGWSGGLSYCTRGGTGRLVPSIIPNTPPRSWPIAFPDAADTNGNGFGELSVLAGSPGGFGGFLSHGATTDQIGTGDVLNWRITVGGVESQFPTTLPDVYATVPALVSYRDGAGNSGAVTYPVPPPFVGSGADYFGDSQGPYQGFPVAPCPAGAPAPCVEGDVVLTLEFWRPQRRAIPGVEEGEWTDIGGLVYLPGVGGPTSPAPPLCHASEVSTSDPNLSPATKVSQVGSGAGFRDAAADQPANRGNTLSFSVNLTKCFRPPVPTPVGPTWDPGESLTVWLSGGVGDDQAVGSNFAAQQLLLTMK